MCTFIAVLIREISKYLCAWSTYYDVPRQHCEVPYLQILGSIHVICTLVITVTRAITGNMVFSYSLPQDISRVTYPETRVPQIRYYVTLSSAHIQGIEEGHFFANLVSRELSNSVLTHNDTR